MLGGAHRICRSTPPEASISAWASTILSAYSVSFRTNTAGSSSPRRCPAVVIRTHSSGVNRIDFGSRV